MKKDFKKVYGYGLIMIVAVLVIVLIVCLSESRIDDTQYAYEKMLNETQHEIQGLKEKVIELENENDELEKAALSNMDILAKQDKHNQIMNDLAEIYSLIDKDEKSLATEKFKKIQTDGFDDGELAFYNTLKKLLDL